MDESGCKSRCVSQNKYKFKNVLSSEKIWFNSLSLSAFGISDGPFVADDVFASNANVFGFF
jgi:hypothetical protein